MFSFRHASLLSFRATTILQLNRKFVNSRKMAEADRPALRTLPSDHPKIKPF
jgi:hypothetical protein